MNANDVDINGFQDPIPFHAYVQNVNHHTGIKRGEPMLQVNYSLVTVQDAVYLLSNNNGYFDGDKKCLILD